jgi:predicted dienelactone hydrolase
MKLVFRFIILAALAAGAVPHANADGRIGIRSIAVPAPERGAELNVVLWYPAAAGGTPVLVGDNPVFKGTPAHQDAPIAGGSFPVILLSHGGLRAAPDLDGWIASWLAAQGFIVAAPRRSAAGAQNAADALSEIWLRPADLSATLTALARDPVLADRIDVQRVGALGFQLGGSSALALAGALRDGDAYARSCDQGGTGLDCAWFARNGIDLHKADAARVERSNHDPRIKAVVAVDPELADVFTAESLSAISIPVQIINLGRTETMLPGLNAASLGERIPEARYEAIADATHFDAFNACKPEGAALLRRDDDDESLCSDGARPREEIHRRLGMMIGAAFKLRLQIGM